METPPLERKLVAILAADVEGYSRLMHADEDKTLATLTSHRRIVDDLIEAAKGQIAGTAGDSVLAEFASVADTVACAVAIQQHIHQANVRFSDDEKMLFRIGINVGDVMVKDGDIFGDGVNIAARLESLAPAGGICVTRGVRDQLRDRTAYEFEDLGEHAVKNIARPIRVFRVCFDPEAQMPISPTSDDDAKDVISSQPSSNPDVESAFWTTVVAGDTAAMYEAYLQKYPIGEFASLAKIKMSELQSAEGKSAAAP